ncbi:hypothetical protein CEXT_128431 [Caerostris extrusa]|uniref:Uncharacterized protein n=1 Tax=Caerostris extrusa TaxID=172846 RepID=A0AAV4SBM5_CAEEX|nr:hypothetical protein CEXT_128431 [Caerostris extrusa]
MTQIARSYNNGDPDNMSYCDNISPLYCAGESNPQHIGLRNHGYANHSPSGPVIESSCAFCTPSTTVLANRWGPGNITIVP